MFGFKEAARMSKKKSNQFMCSSMMLPEHREKLAERFLKATKEEAARFSRTETLEELARCLNQSLFARKPVDLMVEMGEELLPLTGVIVDSNPHEGKISMRTNNQVKTFTLDSVISCQPAAAGRRPD
jgi:hypothetical protein